MFEPQPQQIYKHFKGNYYQILTIAIHSETGEKLVIYQALYGDYKVYARPLSMFMENVDKEKYPDVSQEKRFELVSPESLIGQNDKRETFVEKHQEIQEEPKRDESVEFQIDPLVLEFLDADNYEKRLEILSKLHPRITNQMIDTMAVSVDIEINDGEIEDRYVELKNCLLLYDKFETNRLR